jgi:class 3 adenylate cyclase
MPLDPLTLAGAKAKGKRPYFLKDPDTEKVLNIVMTLAQEVAVMRERMDTIERLLDRNATISRADIEAFTPTKAEAAERGLLIQEFLARILRILQQEREAIEAEEESSEDVAEELAKS